jgi:hypothetical protein
MFSTQKNKKEFTLNIICDWSNWKGQVKLILSHSSSTKRLYYYYYYYLSKGLFLWDNGTKLYYLFLNVRDYSV